MKIRSLDEFLLEKKRDLGSIETNIEIEVDLESSYHADERKFRHDEEITDAEIIDTCDKALEQLTEALILNKVDIGNYIRIFNKSTNLNVIGNLQGSYIPIKFVVVTVMRKKDFKPKHGTHSFFVS